MGTVYKPIVTKALPSGAEIFERRGRRYARWKPAKGRMRTEPVTVPDKGKHKGQMRIVIRSQRYIAKYRDGSGVVQVVPTGCRTEDGARMVLADLERRAERVRASTRRRHVGEGVFPPAGSEWTQTAPVEDT